MNEKYDISQMMYPNDLMDPVYGGNMVVFYINVATASKFLPSENEIVDMASLDTPRNRGLTIGRSVSDINAAVSGVGAAILPALIAGNFAGVGSVVSAAGAIGTGALWVGTQISKTTTREQKRLKSAIALHMPNALSIRYSVDWGSEDLAGAEMISMGLESATAAIKSLSETNVSTMTEEKRNSIDSLINSTAGAAVTNLALGTAGGASTSLRTGLAANPRKEMVFKGLDFRTFSFDYSFFPRDENEAKNVEKIINTFKFHMHPEYKDANSFLYLYPSEFDISYQTKDGENTHIHKHTSCVLTEFNVNYTPQGNFNVFANGMPTQISVQMTFKELAIPTKETIKLGL